MGVHEQYSAQIVMQGDHEMGNALCMDSAY